MFLEELINQAQEHRDRNREKVRKLIKYTMKKCSAPKRIRSIKYWIENLYNPTIPNLLVVISLVLSFVFLFKLLAYKVAFFKKIGAIMVPHSQILVSILTGIGTIIFALMIFIAGTSHEAEEPEKVRVLLKQSYLFPLVVVTILAFVILMYGYNNFFSTLLIVLIAIGTICSIYRVIKVLLSKALFFQKTKEIWRDRIKLMINKEMNYKLGNSILFSYLENKNDQIKLVFNSYIYKQDNYYKFVSNKDGMIRDINLYILREIGELIEKEANKNNFAFKSNMVKSENINIRKEPNNISDKRPLEPNKERYLMVNFEQGVRKGDALILVDKKLIKNKNVIKQLGKLVEQTFLIRSGKNPLKEIRKEMQGLRKRFIDAIRKKEFLTVKDLVETYITLVEVFWEYTSQFNTCYYFKNSYQTRHFSSEGWNTLSWISEDYTYFLREAIKTGDKSIVEDVFYMSINILYRAISYKDRFVFQEFLKFSEYLYIYSSNVGNEKFKDFIYENVCMYLRQIADFYIVSKLENESSSIQELDIFKDFAINFFYLFQNLLKDALDKDDLKNFGRFITVVANLFHVFIQYNSKDWEIKNREMALKNPDISEMDKNKLKKEIQRDTKINEIIKEIIVKREEMLFGISSLVFHRYKQNKYNSQLKGFYEKAINLCTKDLEKLANIYVNSSPEYWGWDLWDIVADGKVHVVMINQWLTEYFVVRTLSLLSSRRGAEAKAGKLELPPSMELANAASDKNSYLNKILDDIENKPNDWGFVLSKEDITQIPLLRKLLKRVVNIQEKREHELKRKKQISSEKVKKFEENVIKGFNEANIMRKIFTSFSLYLDRTKEIIGKNESRFGIYNMLEDKAMFFDEWHILYLNPGLGYGRTLALGENSLLIGKIMKNCIEKESTKFDELLRTKFENPNDIIVLVVNASSNESWKFFENTKHFVSPWHKDFENYKNKIPRALRDDSAILGWYNIGESFIPIFAIQCNNRKTSIIIVSKQRLGRLIQYSPVDREEKEYLQDIFYINIRELSKDEKMIKQIINQKPEWLIKKGSEERQREYLQEHVIINIYESFEYQATNDCTGFFIKIR